MGGLGSGRYWGGSSKAKTESFRNLDVRFLNRNGALKSGVVSTVSWLDRYDNLTGAIQIRAEVDHVTLKYRYRSENYKWVEMELPVKLSNSKCHLGGQRPWFLCPVPSCRKRIAILYVSEVFVCRYCLQLAYETQYEDAELRAVRKANRLRDKLGWSNGILDGKGGKPKGMHTRKYNKLVEQYDLLIDRAL